MKKLICMILIISLVVGTGACTMVKNIVEEKASEAVNEIKQEASEAVNEAIHDAIEEASKAANDAINSILPNKP